MKQFTHSETEYNKSAVTDHLNKNNHTFDLNNVKIVALESNTKARHIKEAIMIRKHHTNMNRDGEMELPVVNNTLLDDGVKPTAEKRHGVRPPSR